MLNPKISSQLMSQTGMGRPGGMASRTSKPMLGGRGSGFAAMENALLKGGVKTPKQAKAVTSGKPARHFNTQASGGDVKGQVPSSNAKISSNPTILASLLANQRKGKLG